VALIVLAYYSAYTLLYGPISQSNFVWQLFWRTVPILVFAKMFSFLFTGVYRGLWRYISIDNVLVYAKAVILSSLASIVALLLAFRFAGLSRRVFVLDAMIMFLALAGSRAAFRLFRLLLPLGPAQAGRRVLIYGAGDAGELLLREVLNNRELQLTPVGFVDDDPLKKGKVIHGYRVFGGNGALQRICAEQQIAEVLISSARLSDERLEEIRRDCTAANVALRRMRIQIESLEEP
jgi:UDP-GlcNAc:undecaprenyl-phosphate GlcNAc-1-phosphate transferase